jgi:hypothetical protein
MGLDNDDGSVRGDGSNREERAAEREIKRLQNETELEKVKQRQKELDKAQSQREFELKVKKFELDVEKLELDAEQKKRDHEAAERQRKKVVDRTADDDEEEEDRTSIGSNSEELKALHHFAKFLSSTMPPFPKDAEVPIWFESIEAILETYQVPAGIRGQLVLLYLGRRVRYLVTRLDRANSGDFAHLKDAVLKELKLSVGDDHRMFQEASKRQTMARIRTSRKPPRTWSNCFVWRRRCSVAAPQTLAPTRYRVFPTVFGITRVNVRAWVRYHGGPRE